MAIRNIIKEGDPVLTKVCREVERFDGKLAQTLDDMFETMKKANGVGLAAPQIGILRRFVIIDVGDGVIELVNPVIVESSGEQREVEGCLSCPGEFGITKRPMKVKVRAKDRNGNIITVEGEGLKAKALCHEIDHLDGIVFKKRAIRMLDESEL